MKRDEEEIFRSKMQKRVAEMYESGFYNASAIAKRAGMTPAEFARVREKGAGGIGKLMELEKILDTVSPQGAVLVQENPRTYPEFEVSDALAETYTILRGLVSMLGDTRGTMKQRIDMLEANLGVLLELVPVLRAQAEKESSENGSRTLRE